MPVNVKTSNSKYAGLTEPEILDVIDAKNLQKLVNAEIRLNNKINTKSNIDRIKKEAKLLHNGANKVHGIEANRNREKQNLYVEQHIFVNDDNEINREQDITVDLHDIVDGKIDFNNMTRIEKIRWKEQQRIKSMNA